MYEAKKRGGNIIFLSAVNGAVAFKWRIILQNFKCTFSKMSLLPEPQISQPCNNMGFTNLSKTLSWQLIERLIKLRNILYWAKLITGKDIKLSIISYRLLYLSPNNNCQFPWLNYVESIIWGRCNILVPLWLKIRFLGSRPLEKKLLSLFYQHLLSFEFASIL
jgi:hypothetical protein